MLEHFQLFNDDCLKRLPLLEDKIDLVVVDLPYGQTACKWDSIIDLKQMWAELKKICKRDCIYVFFCTTKFGYKLIQSNERWFKYDLVWWKSRKVGFLNANKMPLRQHEMMYVFADDKNHEYNDLNNNRNLGLRSYARKVKNYIKPMAGTIKEIDKTIGNKGITHFYSFNSTRFRLPSKRTYDILIDKYKLDKMPGFRTLDDLKKEWEYPPKKPDPTYNPQKTEGKPYITKRKNERCTVYGSVTDVATVNKGDRHPSSIVKFNNPKETLHRTQKPVALCEWLIKSYSNPGDLVLDFTMGSGSTGVACVNTNRRFIGIEKDPDIFKIAHDRIHSAR